MAGSYPINAGVVDSLLKHNDAQLVVVWAEGEARMQFVGLMAASTARSQFTLLCSAGWGEPVDNPPDAVKEVIEGSISWAWRKPTLTKFLSFLQSHDVVEYKANPWFAEWYQSLYNCYLDPMDTKGYPARCSGATVTAASDFKENNDAAFVINAVYAVARGLDATITEFCGDNYEYVCKEYNAARNRSEVLIEKIKEASFEDDSGFAFMFEDGFGMWPIDIYRVEDAVFKMVSNSVCNAILLCNILYSLQEQQETLD